MALREIDENWNSIDDDDIIEREISAVSSSWLFSSHKPNPDNTPLSADIARTPAHVLLAEDDDDMRGLLANALVQEGYLVTECTNGIQLLDHLSGLLDPRPPKRFDVIVSDIRMPGLTGLEILEGLQGAGDLPPTILITAFGDETTHTEAQLAGALVTLDKPFEIEDLLAIVRRVLRYRRQT